MTATKSFDAVKYHPKFNEFAKGKGRWVHVGPAFYRQSVCRDFEISSTFGKVKSAVVLHADGSPNFDRPIYYEADNVNVV